MAIQKKTQIQLYHLPQYVSLLLLKPLEIQEVKYCQLNLIISLTVNRAPEKALKELVILFREEPIS